MGDQILFSINALNVIVSKQHKHSNVCLSIQPTVHQSGWLLLFSGCCCHYFISDSFSLFISSFVFFSTSHSLTLRLSLCLTVCPFILLCGFLVCFNYNLQSVAENFQFFIYLFIFLAAAIAAAIPANAEAAFELN